MNTYFGLMAEFNGRTELPLDEVAPRFFGISPRTAAATPNSTASSTGLAITRLAKSLR